MGPNSGRFQPGNKAHFGFKHSQKTRSKMSEAWDYNKHFTPETKLKISKALKERPFGGRKPGYNAGHFKKGSEHPNWRGGNSNRNQQLRNTHEYKIWRYEVFKRDKFTCVLCGAKSGEGRAIILNADHIKPFAYYPEFRFDVNNGRTLCRVCHKQTKDFGIKSFWLYGRAEYGT